ncbi:MAG: toll/interleukin-1 receptor domain-containing protein [bacterium]|nr:toll/interleukin-1 receptor domain-containing protein [bacterium]
MAPEEPGQLTVLDVSFEGSGLRFEITRVDAPVKDWLAVSWASLSPPEGYFSVANGVVYVKDHPDIQKNSSKGEPDDLGELTYGWRQKVNGAGLMLVLILPPEYSISSVTPDAEAAKIVSSGDRIAIYSMVGIDDEARAAVTWQLKPGVQDLKSEVKSLNRTFYSAKAGYASPGYVALTEPNFRDPTKRIRVFVCYSHEDIGYKKQLLKYLSSLENDEVIEFWHDEQLISGDVWDKEIQSQLKSADIVLALVSQSFISSDYIRKVEIKKALQRRKDEGVRIMPVILSPCDWKSIEWLKSTQVIPKDAGEGVTLAAHFDKDEKRNKLFLTILEQLREAARKIRSTRD